MTEVTYEDIPKEVQIELKSYVYRLVDPRNGQTFYVGKGKNNRVLDHIKAAIKGEKPNDDEYVLPPKFETIRAIHEEGLEVIHIIHRFNMTNEEAIQVEAALIDCYPGLTNIQSGHHPENGVTNIKTLIKTFSLPPFEINQNDKYILIKSTDSVIDEAREKYPLANKEELIQHAISYAWKLSLEKANKFQYVVGAINGVVRGCYKVNKWHRVKLVPDRIYFEGEVADNEFTSRFINKRIPDCFRKKGMANPCLYVDEKFWKNRIHLQG